MRHKNRRVLDDDYYKKLHDYLDDYDGSLVAIFDIGTKACRIILAPKDVPPAFFNVWTRDTFYNASTYSKLGEDVDPINNTLSLNSRRFWQVIKFVRFFKESLTESGRVAETDIHAFGTEIFRWLRNQDEVLEYFLEQTKVPLKILSDDDESYFSSISLQYTISFRNSKRIDSVPNRDEFDDVFLIDQGGGSTEISYFKSLDPKENEYTSIGKFGTVILKDIFFKLDSKGNNIDPYHCDYSILEQMNTLNNYIDETLNNSEHFSHRKSNKKIFYGMGSALHNMFNSSNINSHNKKVSLGSIEDKLLQITIDLNSKYLSISDLYAKIENEQIDDRDLRKLTLFYGLPVYVHILRRLEVEEIRLAGFGLRYGIYIYLYGKHREFLSSKEIEGMPVLFEEEKEKK